MLRTSSIFQKQNNSEFISQFLYKPDFVVLFDEAFNSAINLKQLDVQISYFDNQENVVCRYYYGSQFLGHATAQDQQKTFKIIFKNLDYDTY